MGQCLLLVLRLYRISIILQALHTRSNFNFGAVVPSEGQAGKTWKPSNNVVDIKGLSHYFLY
jgi:hypothetical protein